MEDRELHNLIKGWYARSRRESDPLSKFVFLWFCFNAVLAYESGEDRDRDMLEWLKRQPSGSRLMMGYGRALTPAVNVGRKLNRIRRLKTGHFQRVDSEPKTSFPLPLRR
jgi:hypothetical protein